MKPHTVAEWVAQRDRRVAADKLFGEGKGDEARALLGLPPRPRPPPMPMPSLSAPLEPEPLFRGRWAQPKPTPTPVGPMSPGPSFFRTGKARAFAAAAVLLFVCSIFLLLSS